MNQIPRNLARLGLASSNTWKFEAFGCGGQNGLTKGLHTGQAAFLPSEVRVEKGKDVFWCSCGFSNKQPFCDGTHTKKGSMVPLKFTSQESKPYVFCTCKRSANKPFCDGSHIF